MHPASCPPIAETSWLKSSDLQVRRSALAPQSMWPHHCLQVAVQRVIVAVTKVAIDMGRAAGGPLRRGLLSQAPCQRYRAPVASESDKVASCKASLIHVGATPSEPMHENIVRKQTRTQMLVAWRAVAQWHAKKHQRVQHARAQQHVSGSVAAPSGSVERSLSSRLPPRCFEATLLQERHPELLAVVVRRRVVGLLCPWDAAVERVTRNAKLFAA